MMKKGISRDRKSITDEREVTYSYNTGGVENNLVYPFDELCYLAPVLTVGFRSQVHIEFKDYLGGGGKLCLFK